MFNFFGRFATAHPGKICLAWIVLGIVLSCLAPNWDSKAQDDDITFLPERCPSVRGYRLLEKAFPQDVFASRIVFAVERSDRSLSEDDFQLAGRIVDDLEQLRSRQADLQIGKIQSFRDAVIGNRLTSADRRCTLIQVSLSTPFLAQQTRVVVDKAETVFQARLRQAGSAAPRIFTTGPAGIGRDLIRASSESLDGTTIATIALVVIVLLGVYRAPLLALIPIATIAVSVWVALELMALLTLLPGVHLVNVSKVFAIVILYGAGTDYCLFLISRYREELEGGAEGVKAIRRSVGAVGGSLAASAGTVICGLGLMGLAEFAKVRCAGPAIALSLAVGLIASLTLTPALLKLLGKAVFWPGRIESESCTGQRSTFDVRFWDTISRHVVARPALIWTTAILILLPLALVGFRVRPNYRAIGELHPSAKSVKGLEAIQRHFPAGETGPLTVLLVSTTDWSQPEARKLISHLSKGFCKLDNVSEVRSLTQPLGAALAEVKVESEPARGLGSLFKSIRRNVEQTAHDQTQRMAREHYVARLEEEPARYVTRLDVVMHSDPFDPASQRTLDQVQTWLENEMPQSARALGPVRSECYGVTVNSRDLAEVTEADRIRVNGMVLAGIFVILFVLVRKPWLAAYLLVTVLFSYYATLGATTLIGTWWSARPFCVVDWRVPFFLFVILVAVGEDYNILLIMRMLQERKRYGTEEGTRRALARTGGAITSCGLIMAGTFATLMLASLGTLVQIGFALAFGVLIDTFIVRPFLVPTFTLLVWRQLETGTFDPSPSETAPPTRRAA